MDLNFCKRFPLIWLCNYQINFYRNPPGHIASCMMFSRDGSVLVGGEFNGLFQVDVTRGQVLRR